MQTVKRANIEGNSISIYVKQVSLHGAEEAFEQAFKDVLDA